MTVLPASALIHQVTVVAPAETTDSYGDTERDYGIAATRTPLDTFLQQDTRTETYPDGRVVTEQVWTLFTLTDGVLGAYSRVEWPDRGLTFEVFGQPEPTYRLAGSFDHVEATLRIAEG